MIRPAREDDARLVRALLGAPERAPLWSNLGNARARAADHVAARVAHDRAVRIEPNDAGIWRNRAAAAQADARFRESLASLAEAVRCSGGGDAAAWLELAVAAHDRGLTDLARAHARRAGVLSPGDDAPNRVMAVLDDDRRLDLLQRCDRIHPDDADIVRSLGLSLLSADRADGALAALRRATVLTPGHMTADADVAEAQAHLGLGAAARGALRRAGRVRPAPEHALRAALCLSSVPASRAEISAERARLREALDHLVERPVAMSMAVAVPFYLAYHGEDDRPLMERLALVYRRIMPHLAWTSPHLAAGTTPARAGRPRIGVVSRFFYSHTVMHYFGGLITHLARSGAEVALFALGTVEDDVTRGLRADGGALVRIPDDPTAARETIAEARLDALVFTDIGMEPVSYALALARLAPVQILLLGHPVTAGIDVFDLVLSSDALEPPGAEAHYTEPLRRVAGAPGWFNAIAVPGRSPPTRDQLGLPTGGRLYVCAQSLFKLHPDFDDALAHLLDADPQGRALLFRVASDLVTARLRARLERRLGAAARRVHFHPRVGRQRFADILASADVLLDSPHFSGGQTSVMALGLGLTVVTWPGAFMRGRQTAGLYRLLGIDDPVAADLAEYPALAVALAREPDRRRDLRRRIQERRAAIFEDRRFVEGAAAALWRSLETRR